MIPMIEAKFKDCLSRNCSIYETRSNGIKLVIYPLTTNKLSSEMLEAYQ